MGDLQTIWGIWRPTETIVWSAPYPIQYAMVVIIWGHFIMSHKNDGKPKVKF